MVIVSPTSACQFPLLASGDSVSLPLLAIHLPLEASVVHGRAYAIWPLGTRHSTKRTSGQAFFLVHSELDTLPQKEPLNK